MFWWWLQAWGLGEDPKLKDEEDGSTRGALSLDPEAQAVMEMMGKTFVSKDIRAQDEQQEKEERDASLQSSADWDSDHFYSLPFHLYCSISSCQEWFQAIIPTIY